MTKHVMSFTYEPKIKYVISGLCTQTIRLRGKRPKKVGDTALVHGWKGKARHSKWSRWRLNIDIIKVIDIGMNQNGIFIKDLKELLDYIRFQSPMMNLGGQEFLIWDSKPIDKLAELDFIDPPTGIAMGKLFNSMCDLSEIMPFQIISWKVLEVEL